MDTADSKFTYTIDPGSSSVGPYTFPATVSGAWWTPVEIPQQCVCGAPVIKETVITKHDRVRGSKHVIARVTREAVVCEKCGVVAWYGPDPGV